MATYKGGEIPEKEEAEPGAGAVSGRRDRPDAIDIVGEEDEEAGPDHVPKPGQKGYKQQMKDKVRDSPLHDHPRSKALHAEAGDRKTIRGQEYESTGNENPGGMSQDRATPGEKGELPHETIDKKTKKIEYWRPLKRDAPMS